MVRIVGVSAVALRNLDANGKLHPRHTAVSGYRYYSDVPLNQVINVKPKKRITIGYCRVSSRNKNINRSQKVKKSEKQKRRLQRSISRSYEKNKKGESYCKTNNVIKKEKLLLKRNHRLTNIRKNYLNQAISENRKSKTKIYMYGRSECQRNDEKQTFIQSSSGTGFF